MGTEPQPLFQQKNCKRDPIDHLKASEMVQFRVRGCISQIIKISTQIEAFEILQPLQSFEQSKGIMKAKSNIISYSTSDGEVQGQKMFTCNIRLQHRKQACSANSATFHNQICYSGAAMEQVGQKLWAFVLIIML